MDFLVHMEVNPFRATELTGPLLQQEASRALELADKGLLRRLWRIPGRRANWGIWSASTVDELHEAIASLPLFPFMAITVHSLATHPNDPELPLLKTADRSSGLISND
jgi:muconolactone delta-isomerase